MINLKGFKACFLVIAGPSGVGKDFLINSLITEHPDKFYKVDQVTTRKKRDASDNGYIFLSMEDYEKLRHTLIGRTEVNGNWYGSIFPRPELKDKFGIIILNYDGYIDFLNFLKMDDNMNDIFHISIALDKMPEHIQVKREDRDNNFLDKEREVSFLSDHVIELSEGEYASVDDILNLIKCSVNEPIFDPEDSDPNE